MNAHQRRTRTARHIAHAQNHGLFHAIAVAAFKSIDSKVSEPGWKIRFGGLMKPRRGRRVHAILLL